MGPHPFHPPAPASLGPPAVVALAAVEFQPSLLLPLPSVRLCLFPKTQKTERENETERREKVRFREGIVCVLSIDAGVGERETERQRERVCWEIQITVSEKSPENSYSGGFFRV